MEFLMDDKLHRLKRLMARVADVRGAARWDGISA
jgi:hypothetical protein